MISKSPILFNSVQLCAVQKFTEFCIGMLYQVLRFSFNVGVNVVHITYVLVEASSGSCGLINSFSYSIFWNTKALVLLNLPATLIKKYFKNHG